MNENQVKVHKLCNEISNYKSFVLYGAGYVAEMLLDALEKRNHQPTYLFVNFERFDEYLAFRINHSGEKVFVWQYQCLHKS